MPAQPNINYSSTCNAIMNRINDDKFKIKTTETNLKLQEQYREKINELRENIKVLRSLKEYISPMLKDIQEYIAVRRKESMLSVNNAIKIASEIVPDAMNNISFAMKGNEAWIQTSDNMRVRITEGTGYKSILSAFLRACVIQANPQYLQFILFDEQFAKVCVEYSSTLSAFLKIMTKVMQIISIEQKDEVYANTSYINYTFEKQNGVSVVHRSVVEGEEGDNTSNVETTENL